MPARPAQAACSVFDRHPCHPTFCGVFHRGPCLPETEYPIGQDLRLTIETPADANAPKPAADHDGGGDASDHKLDSIAQLFAALRACWVPPDESEARTGMQMSVRLSFKRTGEIIGAPRVTYTTPDAPRETRDAYHDAINAALARCAPLPFSKGMGGAVAGRPIAIRFVDNRQLKSHKEHP
jgi:hypothetical protein